MKPTLGHAQAARIYMRISYKSVGFAFALISLVAIVWQHFGMTRVLRVDRSWPYFQAIDDRDQGGGSVATLTMTDEGALVTCDLTLDYQYAFCELGIYFHSDGLSGIDLTGYQTMVLAVEYDHPGVDRMRVMARNFNPVYSVRGDFTTLKVNEIDFRPSKYRELAIPLEHFQVASWWRHVMSLPVEYIAPEFSSTVQVDLSTGGEVVPGRYSILLKYLEFRGKWIDAKVLYRGLLLGWLVFVLLALIWEVQQYRKRLRQSQQRESELKALNHLLELQSEKLEKLATHDALTGVRNRAGIRDLFLEHIRDARYRGKPLAAIFIDIDHFKLVNDTYGHQLADKMLVQFAQLMANNIREEDLFARWGGEEFLLLCPDTTLQDASKLAEKLRELIVECKWPHGANMSASFGVTDFAGEKGEEVAAFIGRADRALYEAKAAGRNTVIARSSETSHNSNIQPQRSYKL